MGTILFDKLMTSLPDNKVGNFIRKDRAGNIIKGDNVFNEESIQKNIESSQNTYDNSLGYGETVSVGEKAHGTVSANLYGEDISDAYAEQINGEFGLEVQNSKGAVVSQAIDKEDTVPALVNDFTVIRHSACKSVEDWKDLEGKPGAFPKYETKSPNDGATTNPDGSIAESGGTGGRNLSVESLLIDFSKSDKKDKRYATPYRIADFLYAKYFGHVPLNRLVTLRRFPHPTYDNLSFGKDKGNVRNFKPMAQAITYFGEKPGNKLSDILKTKGVLNWKALEAEVNTVTADTVADYKDTPFSSKLGNFGKAISVLSGKGDLSGAQGERNRYAAQYSGEDYTRKPYGPVNSINKTHIRDTGLEGNLKMSLVFEYELRSYANINPRLAMMDILCNMLALTFNNAKFWGGANRFFPSEIPQFGFLGDQDAFYRGDYGAYFKSFQEDIAKGIFTGADIVKSVISAITSGDLLGAIKNLVKRIGGTALDLSAAKSRPHAAGFKALLTGNPVGEWHITIGNPYRPIAVMGNMIVTDWEMEWNDELGVDDFPTEMKFTINLEQGMPRDKAALESIYNMGDGKMYYKPVPKGGNRGKTTTSGQGAGEKENQNYWTKGTDRESINRRAKAAIEYDYLQKLSGTLF
jgi:hypothetical protein